MAASEICFLKFILLSRETSTKISRPVLEVLQCSATFELFVKPHHHSHVHIVYDQA